MSFQGAMSVDLSAIHLCDATVGGNLNTFQHHACVFSPFCVQNNSKCTLATKAEMWRETMRKGVERWRRSEAGR